jgi:ABC-2 type transport system ATP-binding protein
LAEAVASVIVGSGWGLREMRRVNLSLEDVFLQLTTSEPDAPMPRATTASGADDAAQEVAA